MTRRFTMTLGLLALAAAPVAANASHSAGQGPRHVAVAGTGIRTALLPGGNA